MVLTAGYVTKLKLECNGQLNQVAYTSGTVPLYHRVTCTSGEELRFDVSATDEDGNVDKNCKLAVKLEMSDENGFDTRLRSLNSVSQRH